MLEPRLDLFDHGLHEHTANDDLAPIVCLACFRRSRSSFHRAYVQVKYSRA